MKMEKVYLSGIGWCLKPIYYYVYILFNKEKPIYVGCTKDLENRLNKHKKSKDFDSYSVVYSHSDRKKSLEIEKSLITAVKFINNDSLNKTKFICIKNCQKIKF